MTNRQEQKGSEDSNDDGGSETECEIRVRGEPKKEKKSPKSIKKDKNK